MILESVKATNFMHLREVDLPQVPQSTFFLGVNGQGKTTILNAIRFCLCGRIYDNEGDRVQNPKLIGHHGKSATIEVGVLVNGEHLKCVCTIAGSAKFTVLDAKGLPKWKGGSDEIRKQLWTFAAIDPRRAECAMNPRAYVLSKELGVLLSELVSCGQEQTPLREFCGEHYAWVRSMTQGDETSAKLAQFGQYCYDQRAEYKKRRFELGLEIDHIKDVKAPMSADKTREIQFGEIDKIKAIIADLEKKRNGLLAESENAGTGMNPDVWAEAKKALDIKIVEAQKSAEDAAAKVAEASATVRKAEDEVAALNCEHAGAVAYVQEVTRSVQAAEDACSSAQSNTCPIFNCECPKMAENDAIDKAQAGLADAQRQLTLAKEREGDALNAVNAARQAYALARATHEQVNALAQRKVRDCQRYEEDLRKLEANKPARAKDVIEAELQSVLKRISAGQKIVEDLNTIRKRTELESQLAELDAEIARLDWGTKAFKDGGYRVNVIAAHKADFETRANTVMHRFGYKFSIEVLGKTVEATMGRLSESWMYSAASASKGELALLQYAVARAFNTGTPILLDDVEGLSGAFRTELLQLAGQKEHPQSLLFAATYAGGIPPKFDVLTAGMKPMSIVWVENGSASLKDDTPCTHVS